MARRNSEAKITALLHWAFIGSCFIYAMLGWFHSRTAALSFDAVLPGNLAMIALAPGVASGVAGILFLRRATSAHSMNQRLSLRVAGCALLEGLALTGLAVFLLPGGETAPLYTACGLAAVLLFIHRPSIG